MKYFDPELLAALSGFDFDPRYVVTIENQGETYFFTSSSDIVTPAPENTFDGLIDKLSSTSQQNTFEKRLSTIGNFSVELVEHEGQISEWLRAIDAAGSSLAKARIRLYIGKAGLDFDKFALVQTQFIRRVNPSYQGYAIKSHDALRFVKKTVFDLYTTHLTATVNPSDTTIHVISTDGFDRVEHGNSYTDGTAGQTVGYLFFEREDANGNKLSEVITYTGKTATSFTGCVRGVLDTRALTWQGPDGTKKGTTVKEHVYLELPGPKLMWALLTRNLYSQPGAKIPAHWSPEVSEQFLDLTSFENIGLDTWNPANDNDAKIFRFDGIEKVDAKTFLEKEICPLISAGLIVQGTGELALKRTPATIANTPAMLQLDTTNLFDVSEIDHDLSNIVNSIAVDYSYRRAEKAFKRHHIIEDLASFQQYGESTKIASYGFKGLHYTRHNLDTVRGLLDSLRERLAYPQYNLSVVSTLAAVVLDVADVVRLNLEGFQDYKAENHLNRSFEIKQMTVDWLGGSVRLSLTGSTERAKPLAPIRDVQPSPVDHTNWTAFESVLTPGTYNISDSVLTITDNNDLTGFESLSDNGWHYLNGMGDVVINAGAIVTCTKNFILDAADLTVHGELNLDGRGLPGSASSDPLAVKDLGAAGGPDNRPYELRFVRQKTLKGYVGSWESYGGSLISQDGTLYRIDKTATLPPRNIAHLTPAITSAGKLTGLPTTLAGQPGIAGKSITAIEWIYGDDGAYDVRTSNIGSAPVSVNSGGGMLLIINNLFGEGIGTINLNGKDGNTGPKTSWSFEPGYDSQIPINPHSYVYPTPSSGSYPGSLVCLLKSPTALPDIRTMLSARLGASPNQDEPFNSIGRHFFRIQGTKGLKVIQNDVLTYSGGHPAFAAPYANGYELPFEDVVKLAFLVSDSGDDGTAGDTGPVSSIPVKNLTITQKIDTSIPLANIAIVTATVTPPIDDTYSHAIVDFRIKGSIEGWNATVYKTGTKTNTTLAADGTEYEFRARSVSKDGVISNVEKLATIKLKNITSDPDTSDGNKPDAPIELKVADVTGLTLVNRLGNTTPKSTQFKSGNCEFTWNKVAATLDGNIVATDPTFAGYEIKIYDGSNNLKRTETTKDSFYRYSLEQNRVDGTGRQVRIDVKAFAYTGGSSTNAATLTVNNPQPVAPSNVVIQTGYSGFKIQFDIPTNDVDFVGADVFYSPGAVANVYVSATPESLTGNNFSVDELEPGTTYTVGVQTRDQFGAGGKATQMQIVTRTIPSSPLTEITQPVTIDGISGRVITDNAGYQMWMGAVDRPTVSPVTLVLHSWDSISGTSSFYLDASGKIKATNAEISGKVTIGGGSTGYSNMADRPARLADIDSTEGAKLQSIASGATRNTGALANKDSVGYNEVTGTKPPTNANNTEAVLTNKGIADGATKNTGALANKDSVGYNEVTGSKPPTNANNTEAVLTTKGIEDGAQVNSEIGATIGFVKNSNYYSRSAGANSGYICAHGFSAKGERSFYPKMWIDGELIQVEGGWIYSGMAIGPCYIIYYRPGNLLGAGGLKYFYLATKTAAEGWRVYHNGNSLLLTDSMQQASKVIGEARQVSVSSVQSATAYQDARDLETVPFLDADNTEEKLNTVLDVSGTIRGINIRAGSFQTDFPGFSDGNMFLGGDIALEENYAPRPGFPQVFDYKAGLRVYPEVTHAGLWSLSSAPEFKYYATIFYEDAADVGLMVDSRWKSNEPLTIEVQARDLPHDPSLSAEYTGHLLEVISKDSKDSVVKIESDSLSNQAHGLEIIHNANGLKSKALKIKGDFEQFGHSIFNLAFSNSWTNYAGGYENGQYMKSGAIIYLHGLIKGGSGTNGVAVARLPSGYRPKSTHIFICASSTTTGLVRVDIKADGYITVRALGNSGTGFTGWVSLSGVHFLTS